MIEVRGLAKSFGDLRVVDDVSFVARDGEITGLIGPNGAGKTTMFRLICTVLRPNRGTTLIDGIDSRKDPLAAPRRQRILAAVDAVDQRGPAVRPQHRADQAKHCRLAGAVRPDEAGNLTVTRNETDVVHHPQIAEGFCEPADLDH